MKMKSFNHYLLVLSLYSISATLSPNASAGSSEGQVTYLAVLFSDVIFFSAGVPTGKPACATTDQWAIPLNTESGRAMYSLLIAAQIAGKTVQVSGAGHCNAYHAREQPVYISVQ